MNVARIPYSLPLTHDEAAARLKMPVNASGHVVNLFCTPPAQVRAYEQQWRQWAKSTPRHLWPKWFDAWRDSKKGDVTGEP